MTSLVECAQPLAPVLSARIGGASVRERSVAIDLKSDTGRTYFYALVKAADVVLDNFSADVTRRLNVDHDTLSAINPRIITCSVSGFGESGPNYKRPAFDQIVQGLGGGMSITGAADGPPMRAGLPA